ncbi:MAG: hypothetical protein GY716_03130 [bacterium]|nr:hypothetical protein [bacterium]
MVIALFALVLLTGMGTAVMFLGQHEARTSKAGLRAKKSFFLAEAGLEDGRMTLYAANGGIEFGGDLLSAAGIDGTIDFDPAALSFTYANGQLTGLSGYNDDVPLRAVTALPSAQSPGWYAAFLTNDPLEGISNTTDSNHRVMITAVGAGEDESVEMVQAILEPFQAIPPTPPAALTMLGPDPAFFDNGNSNAQSHSGDDCGVSGGAYAPIVGTVSPESRDEVQDDMNRPMNRPDNFTSGPYTGEDTVADLTDLSDPIVNAAGHGIIDPVWVDCPSLKAVIEQLAASADYYCNSHASSCSIPSTASPDTVVFIDGDLSSTPSGSYTGILVVTGELVYRGNTGWDGIVMVVGEGRLLRSGGGNGNPSGGVIIGAIDPTPNGPPQDRSDWCTQGTDGFMNSFYDASGGGASTVQWCTGYINAANAVKSYKVTNFLQR